MYFQHKIHIRLACLLVLLLLLAACAVPAPPPPSSAASDLDELLTVVATYSILGDLVANVGGEHVNVVTLVGPDGDVHTFEPTPADSVALTQAALIFENGLEFESWLDDLYTAAGAGGQRVAVTDGIALRAMEEGHDEHADEEHADDEHIHSDIAPKRLVVADGTTPVVHILTIGEGEILTSYEVAGPARVYVGADETLAYAVQTSANQVNVINSGVRYVPHDDHYDLDLTDPALLDFALDGPTPIHFVAHDGLIAIFNDGDGTAVIFPDSGARSNGDVVTVDSGRPHHGVALPMDDLVVLSIPNPEDPEAALPVGVAVRTLDGEDVASFAECPGLHGEASLGHDAVAFGCADGVLILARDGDIWTGRKIANPAENPDEARVGTLYYNQASGLLAGNWSSQGLTLFDLEADVMTPIILPVPMWAFAWSEYAPHHLLALTIDGSLHTVDAETGEILGSVAVVDAFELPQQGEEGVLRPALIAAGDMAYISSPNTGEVVEVHVPHLEVARRLTVEGAPFSLAAFGAQADPHANDHKDEAADDHAQEEHADEHGHHHSEFDPHVWHDVANAMVMVEAIRDALSAADPAYAAGYAANADAYLAELAELDGWVTAQIKSIPPQRRKLVTAHNTFGYFAQRYGLEVIGSALSSLSTEDADPSAGELAALIEEIRAEGVPALFAENVSNPDLIERIAQETGITVGEPLYTDALGAAGSDGATYIEMVRHNVTAVVAALGE